MLQVGGRQADVTAVRRHGWQLEQEAVEDVFPEEDDTSAASPEQGSRVPTKVRAPPRSPLVSPRGLAVGPRQRSRDEVTRDAWLKGLGLVNQEAPATGSEPQTDAVPYEARIHTIFAEQLDGVRRTLLEGQRRVLTEFGLLHSEKKSLQRQIPVSVTSNEEPLEPALAAKSPGSITSSTTHLLDVSAPQTRRGSEDTTAEVTALNGDPTKSTEIDFKVLPIWHKTSMKLLRGARLPSEDSSRLRFRLSATAKSPRFSTRSLGTLARGLSADEYVHGDDRAGDERSWILHPNTHRRIAWELCSVLLTMYDMIVIPLLLFNLPEDGFFVGMAWATRLFWTLDIAASLNTGFICQDGIVEMRRHHIVHHYLKHWFLMDIGLVLFDWTEFFLRSAGFWGVARGAKSVARPIRIIRMLRLVRVFRMQEAMSLVVERISSEKLLISVNIAKLLTGMIFVAHVMACLWYVIGDTPSPSVTRTWVWEYGYDQLNLSDAYLMSMHWSLSQFTGGMEEVTPVSQSERMFAILAFVMGFIISVLLVSSLTSQMTQLSIIGSHNSKQLSILRRFLSQSGISSRLAFRLQRNAQHSMMENQRVMPEESVGLFRLISKPLLEELHMEVYAPIYAAHPFFKLYALEQRQVMRKVCHSASSTTMFCKGDIIFTPGELPAQPKMYFPRSGNLKYKPLSGSGDKYLALGDWIAEPVLWTRWMHRGMLVAVDDCRLCMLDAAKFQEIVAQFEHACVDPREYAQVRNQDVTEDFVASMNNAVDEVNDLPGRWFLTSNEGPPPLTSNPRRSMWQGLIPSGVASAVGRVSILPAARSGDLEICGGRIVTS